MGCIGSQGWYQGRCQYNGEASACRFGTFVGTMAMLACLVFLLADARFDSLVSVVDRKRVVIADLGFSGLWTFIWLICFCHLSNLWRKTPHSMLPPQKFGRNNVQAAITFSLFSTFSWACLTFLSYRRYKIGASQAFAPPYNAQESGTIGSEAGSGLSHPPFNQMASPFPPPPIQTQYPPPVY
ncbi:unnamed protein product [Gordionus sp. m RMFG-2023]